ncbi:MAG TPA: phospholipase, partial [Actinomycetota bacterium]
LVRRPAGAPEGALVLFHGRGSDEYDLYRLLDDLDPDQRLLGVTPRGPLSLPPGGAHWYITRQVGYPDPGTFHATYRLVSGWLDELARSTGIPTERTILGGFSQGAVMTHAMGLGAGRPTPAAMLAFSGFIPTVEGNDLDLSAPLPPVAIGHGTYDNIIAVEFGREARDRLTAAGADVTYRESPIRHGIDPGFLDELVPWVASAIDRAAVARG